MIGCTTNNPATRRYLVRFAVAMTFYIAFILVTVTVLQRFHPTGWVVYPLAILPALPILASLWIIGAYLKEEKDEVVRTMMVEKMLWAIGATMAVTTVWGFLENFAHVPHMDLFLVFPMFWAFVGFASPMVDARYK